MASDEDDDGPDAFVLAILVVGGLMVMGFTGYMLYDERQTIATAEEVDAEVLGSEVIERDRGTSSSDRESYVPTVSYRYSYGGETYTSDQVFPGGNIGIDRDSATEVVERYEEGETVTAYVDPKHPSESFLETTSRFTLGMSVFAVLGFVMFVAGTDMTVKTLVGVSVLARLRDSL